MALVQKFVDGREKGEVKLNPITEKDQRTIVHQLLKKIFVGINSTTTPNNHITVTFDQPKRWDKKQYFHCEFAMCKENKETLEVIGLLSKFLQLKNNKERNKQFDGFDLFAILFFFFLFCKACQPAHSEQLAPKISAV